MTSEPRRTWHIAAPFFLKPESRWLDDFIGDARFDFVKIRAPQEKFKDWHQARGKTTGLRTWITHFVHAARALKGGPYGIVTVFPQLAMCTAFLKRLTFGRARIVAYTFNLGALPRGPKQWLARMAAPAIDLFVVHSPDEIVQYAAYLGVVEEKVVFIPLQRGRLHVPREEDGASPFILSMGSAHRDYGTLIRAVDQLGIRTVIVTREDEIADLPKSGFVEFRSNMTRSECHELLAKARLSVTPIDNMETASGQITFLNAMQLGVPVIATRCPGTKGYVHDGENGYLVKPRDVQDMKEKIRLLWSDDKVRKSVGESGLEYAEREFSDEGAASRLEAILEDLSGNRKESA